MRLLLLLLIALPVSAQHSPYASMKHREIKALSDEQVRGYLDGAGMGLALPAEMNGYPGPKHVIELAAQLELTPEQRSGVQRIFDRMKTRATEIGTAIVAAEKALDEAFGARTIDAASLRARTSEIARLQGELRNVHLAAHLETKAVLTPAQLAAYSRLRGYDDAGAAHVHEH